MDLVYKFLLVYFSQYSTGILSCFPRSAQLPVPWVRSSSSQPDSQCLTVQGTSPVRQAGHICPNFSAADCMDPLRFALDAGAMRPDLF